MVETFGTTEFANIIQAAAIIFELVYTIFHIFRVFDYIISDFVFKVWLLACFG